MYDGMQRDTVAYDGMKREFATPLPPIGADMGRLDREELVRRANAMRAAMVGELIGWQVARVVDAWRRRRAYHLAVNELRALDDHMLRDIGVQRYAIDELVYHAPRLVADARGATLVDFVRRAIVAPVKRWLVRVRTSRELQSLDDKMLRDIGIERGQIEAIAEATATGQRYDRHQPAAMLGMLGLPAPANTNTDSAKAKRVPSVISDAAD